MITDTPAQVGTITRNSAIVDGEDAFVVDAPAASVGNITRNSAVRDGKGAAIVIDDAAARIVCNNGISYGGGAGISVAAIIYANDPGPITPIACNNGVCYAKSGKISDGRVISTIHAGNSHTGDRKVVRT